MSATFMPLQVLFSNEYSDFSPEIAFLQIFKVSRQSINIKYQ